MRDDAIYPLLALLIGVIIIFLAAVLIRSILLLFNFPLTSSRGNGCKTCSNNTVPPPPSNTDPSTGLSTSMIIRTGNLQEIDTNLCKTGELSTCFGQNPASPYLSINWNQSDPTITIQPDNVIQSDGLIFGMMTLGPTDALVISGITPPEMIYFGYTMYVYTIPTCPNVAVFASAADTANQTYFTTGNVSPFNRKFVLVYTANLAVAAALVPKIRAFVPSSTAVLFFPIAQRPTGTEYVLLTRVAHPNNENSLQNYLKNPTTKTQILRGGSRFINGPMQTTSIWKPFATNGIDENITPGVKALNMATLRVMNTLTQIGFSNWSVVPVQQQPIQNYFSGDDAINNCLEFNGDNRDAIYFAAIYENFGPTEIAVNVGYNHVHSGNLYTNFSVYDAGTLTGLYSIDVTTKDQLWTTFLVTRDLNIVPEQNSNETQFIFNLPTEVKTIVVIERIYLRGNIAPAANTLLPFNARRGYIAVN